MKKKEIFSWIKSIIIACILIFMVREYIFAPIVVNGESMMPTLKNDEHIILNEMGKNKVKNINRFDIIVFHATKKKDYIKRVIGLPGDHIEYRNDMLYINGKKYDEPYLDQYKKDIMTGPLTEDFKLEKYTGSSTVPQGQLFVMGDNRKYSVDSRSQKVGTISADKIVGKAKLAYWPIKEVQWIK
ncbi:MULTISPECIES: signal peptidase I [Priestia]|uniref:Signal peptidase I n=1 Tax=Priestia aryabhattai TaxID=412384 RepID=A0ABD5KSK4_PRIAR|nr:MULTISPECIES: signal peptidase I [Priestia]AWD66650.1 signal peptidase I [Priestia megaterium]MBY0214710.1 signal peptidase I [Priestia aryabhattai]MDC7763661.1 signal peptidase I [Priestia aryabhattai]MEB4884500.1 signal peptidase I [Priestia megaterium]MED4046454.1 signal peptidase I [Priestia aryabhattai]